MSDNQIGAFFEKLQTDAALQKAFVAFGKEHGFAFDPSELTEQDLDNVAGGLREPVKKLDPYPDDTRQTDYPDWSK